MRNLNDQVAIVTGAARGIGQGIASVLAAEGATVALADVNSEGAESAAAVLCSEGLRAVAIGTDVTDRQSTTQMAATVLAKYGRIDILAANAGIYPSVDLAAIEDSDWDRVIGINAKGALYAVQACAPAMLERGYGRIVLTSSITGPMTGYPGYSLYGASKAAMLGLMRSAALEFAAKGITINAVLPGNVATPGLEETGEGHMDHMASAIPMGRFAEPEDVGWAVRYLASAEAGYVTGQTLVIDGGQVLPEAPWTPLV